MKGKTLCIVIALMVLSVSAIIVANPSILGEFSSTLNGVPVQVTISRQDNGTITTMWAEDLVENWADYNQRFVRFMGAVESVDVSEPKQVALTLTDSDGYKVSADLFVYPLDAPHLPTAYQEEHAYEFTGFLTGDIPSPAIPGGTPQPVLCIYAFEIRHYGKSPALRAAEAMAEGLGRQNLGEAD